MSVRLKALGLVLVFLLTSLLGYWFVLDVETDPPVLQSESLDGRDIVYFGVISRYSPRSIIAGYQPLMEYLTANTPYHFKLRLSRTYLETVRQLSQGEIDFASLGNYTYINAPNQYGFKCIAMPINASGTLENYDDIIVRNDSPAHSLKDLEGKSFAFASRQSFSAWMAIWMLAKAGITLDQLSHHEHLSYHDIVAEKVLRGDFDAGMVKSIVAEQYHDQGIRVLERSPAIPSVPVVVGSHVAPEKVKFVLEALLSLSDRIASGDLSTAGWDREVAYGFRPGSDSLYHFPRSILKELGQANAASPLEDGQNAD